MKKILKEINVKIDATDFLNLLMDRLKVWTDDKDALNLYEKMYQKGINNNVFDGVALDDVTNIIDNDYINYCDTCCKKKYF